MKKSSYKNSSKSDNKIRLLSRRKARLSQYELVIHLNNQWIASQNKPSHHIGESSSIVRSIN